MLDPLPLPRLRARLAAARHRPEAPDLLAGGLIERGHEPAHALVATGAAGHHQVADRQRRAGRVVVLAPVGHFRFPQQRAGRSIERDEMRVIGDHEHAVAGDADAAVHAAGGVADQPLGPRALVVPDLAAAAGVERVAFVGARHVHHAVGDDRRHLQTRRVRQAEDPLRRQPAGVALGDLRERTVAAAGRLAVVARPVGLRRHGAILLAGLSEQVDPAIVSQQLEVVRALIEDQTRKRAAAGERDGGADRSGAVARLQRPQIADEIAGLGLTQVRKRRHARGRQPLAKERRQILVAPRRHARRNAGTELAAVSVAAVAAGAAAHEDLPPRIGRLGGADQHPAARTHAAARNSRMVHSPVAGRPAAASRRWPCSHAGRRSTVRPLGRSSSIVVPPSGGPAHVRS